jgi:hypothetical protein
MKAGSPVPITESQTNTETASPSPETGQKQDPARQRRAKARNARIRVGFLYNHDAPHQVAHSAPIAAELANTAPDFDVQVIASSEALLDRARNVLASTGTPDIGYHLLEASIVQNSLSPVLDQLGPFSRLMNLYRNKEFLAGFDALVVPERTTLFLKKLLGSRTPKLICTRHGSGDRSVGFQESVSGFDLVMFSGPKTRDRYVDLGYLRPEQTAIVGYPKFDAIPIEVGSALFDNGRPTVVYSPNPDPLLSSFYDMGLDVLEYFYNSRDYNLVFAPHMMLFKRKLHTSLEKLKVRLRPNIPEKYFHCPHIKIDMGSPALMDMTYMRAADIYLGDVSSQVYEFIRRPRPCVFLNASGADWQGNPNFLFWTMGPVADRVADLGQALEEASQSHYLERQKELFDWTFQMTEERSSLRAAHAIGDFLIPVE